MINAPFHTPRHENDSSFTPLGDQVIVSLLTKLVKYLQKDGFSLQNLGQARALLESDSGVLCQKSVDILTRGML